MASFVLDVMYIVMIVMLMFAAGVLFWHGHAGSALFCLVPAGLSGLCVHYRLKVARYYLGRYW
jgi:hypothetical protein